MSKPVRLAKDDGHNSFSFNLYEKIEAFVFTYATILIPLFIIIGLVLFVLLCYAICGVSATESGVQYNQLERII